MTDIFDAVKAKLKRCAATIHSAKVGASKSLNAQREMPLIWIAIGVWPRLHVVLDLAVQAVVFAYLGAASVFPALLAWRG